MTDPKFTIPGMNTSDSATVIDLLQQRLIGLIDLSLTLKHVHWNVVGPHFIGVHEMLDPHIDGVRQMVDAMAERIATMGGEPKGTPGFITENRSWDDYALGRATVIEHLGALNLVYAGVIEDHRSARKTVADLDPVSEDMLISQLGDLELYHWFVRAHLETSGGELTVTAKTEEKAARQALEGSRS